MRKHVLLLSALLGLLVGCGPTVTTPEETNIVYGLTLSPSGFDPHINQSAEIGIVLRQVYDTLVFRDPETLEIVPGLAATWEVSPDGLVYTFGLRQDVTFHDGTIFNAQAVAANLDRILDPALGSQKAIFLLGPFERYELVDNFTVRLYLSEPYSPLLDSLSQVYLGMASPTALETYAEEQERYQFHQVGTGPYTFEEYVPGDRLVLRRNTNYAWGPRFLQASVENPVDVITYRFFTDPSTRSLALESGEAQIMGELLPTDARSLAGNSAIRVVPTPIPGQPLQFLMNTQVFPTDSVAIRQALIYATNRSAIIDAVFQGYSPVASGPITSGTLYYNRELQNLYPYDITQAQTLLADAGFEDTNGDGVLEFSGVDVTVRMIVPPWGALEDVAQLVQDQWRIVGIQTEIELVPTFTSLLDAVQTGEYNMVAFNSFGLDPSLLEQFYSTDGASNWTGYSNINLDQAFREAARQPDELARAGTYLQIQRLIMEEALILPIREYVNLNASSASVEGLTYDAYGWFPLMPNVAVSSS